MTSIPDDLDILDNKVFVGVDTASQLSLNGPRATNVIAKLVPNYDTFRLTVRAVRMWFRRKGMYSNKLGFLGGINFNIMVTYVCQMFPNQTASKLLLVFFRLFEQWPWQTKALNLCTQMYVPSLRVRARETKHRHTGHSLAALVAHTPPVPSPATCLCATTSQRRTRTSTT